MFVPSMWTFLHQINLLFRKTYSFAKYFLYEKSEVDCMRKVEKRVVGTTHFFYRFIHNQPEISHR
jgi:hypothetical protein